MRQYIGARYVPKFEGTWANNRTYEALCVVSYNGDTYTSKKPVPVGIVPTDTTYWALTGAYNTQIADLTEKVDRIVDRKFIFVGDSYGDQSGEWPYIVKGSLKIPDANFNNLCVTDTGFVDYGNGKYLDQLTGFTGDKTSITDIVIAGGLNDSRYATYAAAEAALGPAMQDVKDYIDNNYPNAHVWIAFIGSCLYDSTYYSTVPLANRKITKYMYEISGMQRNWTLIGGADDAIHNSTSNFNADGIHPSAIGSVRIGQAIATVLRGGVYNNYYPPIAANNGFATGFGGTFSVSYEVNGNETVLSFVGTLNLDNVTLTSSNVDVLNLSQITFPRDVAIKVPCVMKTGSTPNYVVADCVFIFKEDKMVMRTENLNSSGSNYETYNITSGAIYVNHEVRVTIPTFDIN